MMQKSIRVQQPHSPILSSDDETSEQKQIRRLKILHHKQKQQRTQRRKNKQLLTYYRKEFNSIEYIIEMLDLLQDEVECPLPEFSLHSMVEVFFRYVGLDPKYGIKFYGVRLPSELFRPSVNVRCKNGIMVAEISLPKCVAKRFHWKEQKTHWYTLSSNNPQYSRNFYDDFYIVRVDYLFDVLQMMYDHINNPLVFPKHLRKYKHERTDGIDRVMKRYYEAMIDVYKRCCDDLIAPSSESQ